MTNAFNAGERHAFLISLKAGGVGLNLTGADTVILVDLWWNPAVKTRLLDVPIEWDRKQNVEVYRMITRGTIEENPRTTSFQRHLVSTILDGTETRSVYRLRKFVNSWNSVQNSLKNSVNSL